MCFLGLGMGPVGSKTGPGMIFSNPETSIIFLIFLKRFIYFWQHWVFVAAPGLFLVAASGAALCCGSGPSPGTGLSCFGA